MSPFADGMSLPAPVAVPVPLDCNMGAPMGRRRSERVCSTILGHEEGPVQLPRRRTAGFLPREDGDFVERAWALLARLGFADADAARTALGHRLPATPLALQPWDGIPTLDLADGQRRSVGREPLERLLEEALLLGLCTCHLYDPARPVVWTTKSLSRRVVLYALEGFYAV